MIKHIPQRGFADCGVAAIAMIAGVEYERVLASVPSDVYFHGLWLHEILHALFKITKVEWGLKQYVNTQPTLRDFIFPQHPVLALVVRTGNFESDLIRVHYIVVSVEDREVYDPAEQEAQDIATMRDSEKGNWKLVALISNC